MMEKLGSSQVVKIGIVVRDIEAVAERYAELFNVETPVVKYPNPNRVVPPEAYKKFRGKEYDIKLKGANIYLDPIYLELIEPVDDTPSPWLEHLEKFGPSVCFVSFYINGFRHQVDLMGEKGYPVIFEEEKGTERYAYFDTLEKLGITLELKERDQD